jgi:branched-subunit amino acid permease
MPDDRIHEDRTGPVALLGAVFGDIGDLMQKEIALAKCEIQQNLTQKVMGLVWTAVAGMVLFAALLTIIGGLVFLIASYDVALHWSAFSVAAIVAIMGLIALMVGKRKLNSDTTPSRSMRQVRRDISTVKEQVQ